MDYQIYFIPTPIGNLEDITLRAINTLKEVDIIACEDTRESRKLLDHYGINKELTSYHKFNEISKSQEIIENSKNGITYGVITDQGMPGISDPGHILIKKCIEEGVTYTILPGASSILTGLVGSGLDNSSFVYYGFIPKKQGEKQNLYKELKKQTMTSILFDTPHNIEKTIEDFKKIFPHRKLCLARELTKKFEEYFISEISDIDTDNLTLKGEFVLILEGNNQSLEEDISDFEDEIKDYIKQGLKTKEITKIIKEKSSLNKNEIYEYVLRLSK